MRFQREKEVVTKPTAAEVIEAIFSIFTEEEMKSMRRKKMVTGEPDPGIKQLMLNDADRLEPNYSIERSIEIAKVIADPCRGNLLRSRAFIFREFIRQLFSY